MRNTVFIEGLYFSKQELNDMNIIASCRCIEFKLIKTKNLLESDKVIILISLFQSIGFDTTYDVLKYILFIVIDKLRNIKSNQVNQNNFKIIELTCGDITDSLKINFELTDEQKDKIIDAFVSKFNKNQID